MARVRVVLVRPESAANVGASARVIRNAGGEGLDLVTPGDWRTVECWRTAWGAQDVLESAGVYPDLASALDGTALAVGLAGRRRAGLAPVDIRDAAAEISSLGRDEKVALVFGPETSGLSNEELARCGRRARIPSHPDQPSFNLSHAVAIAVYEVQRGLTPKTALPRVNSDGHFRDWQALVHRADVTPRELKLLEHMARKMAHAGNRG
jgi:TrmH family RNA methyltransferase